MHICNAVVAIMASALGLGQVRRGVSPRCNRAHSCVVIVPVHIAEISASMQQVVTALLKLCSNACMQELSLRKLLQTMMEPHLLMSHTVRLQKHPCQQWCFFLRLLLIFAGPDLKRGYHSVCCLVKWPKLRPWLARTPTSSLWTPADDYRWRQFNASQSANCKAVSNANISVLSHR